MHACGSLSALAPHHIGIIMASALSLGLGLLGAGLAGRVAFQMLRAGKGGAEQFVKGGFKGKMDKAEAMQILGLRSVQFASRPRNVGRIHGGKSELNLS